MYVIMWPIATMSNMAGVWTVTVVTVHRYIAVCLPHHVTKFANLRVARYQASCLQMSRPVCVSRTLGSQPPKTLTKTLLS